MHYVFCRMTFQLTENRFSLFIQNEWKASTRAECFPAYALLLFVTVYEIVALLAAAVMQAWLSLTFQHHDIIHVY